MSFPTPPTPQELASGSKNFKGLQKLKYFCQLCKKQCPDKNGFKCHLASNTHLMNMRLFGENPDKYIEDYSAEFEQGYIDVLRKKYQGKKVLANQVYQDYIRDKFHTHMNATKWTTLTSFIEHLQQNEKVESEWTDKGLFISYVESTVEAATKKIEEEKKLAAKLKKEQKEKEAMDQQLEIAKKFQEQNKNNEEENKTETIAPIEINNHPQISFSFSAPTKPASNPLKKPTSLMPNIVISLNPNKNDEKKESEFNKDGKRKGTSAIERVLEQAKATKKVKPDPFGTQPQKPTELKNDEEDLEGSSWIAENIIVKVKDDSLQKYFNQKGKIIRVVAPFIAEVEMLSNSAKIQIDQDLLETVIPVIGNKVKILKRGPYFGQIAILESIHQDSFSASVLIEESDTALELPFELISKAVV